MGAHQTVPAERRKKRSIEWPAEDTVMNRTGSTVSKTSVPPFGYPYPRGHSTMMVIPSQRPFAPEDDPAHNSFVLNSCLNSINNNMFNGGGGIDNGYVRPRPPLNRAIPTIPESRSNESIMTHASSAGTTAQTPSSISADKCVVIGNPMATNSGIPKSVSQQSIKSNRDLAPSPVEIPAPRTSGIPRFAPRPPVKRPLPPQQAETPRSPLMSVAHSVRSSLSKLGNRFSSSSGRGESPQREEGKNIKYSRSLNNMPSKSKLPKPVGESGIPKSSSMDAPGRSRSSDTLKIIIATNRSGIVSKPSSLPLPRTSRMVMPTRLDPIISEDSEGSRMESIQCERLAKTREADEYSVPTPPSYDLKDLVSRFVDDTTTALTTNTEHRENQANNVEPDEITIAEEIPMDTNHTPDEVATIPDDNLLVEDVIRSDNLVVEQAVTEEVMIGEDAITVVREQHATMRVAPPVFVAPAPPAHLPPEEVDKRKDEEDGKGKEEDHSANKSSGESSDSTLKENVNIIFIQKLDNEKPLTRKESTREKAREKKEKKERAKNEKKERERMEKEKEKERERQKEWEKEKEREREREKREEKEKSPRTPLSTRGLKNILLLRKHSEKTAPKPPPTSRSMPLSTSRNRLSLPMRRSRFAPLAEFESTIVENSPAVEITPWAQYGASPKLLRRNSERSVKELIKEVERVEVYRALRGDDNGNDHATASPRVHRHIEEQKGLIDDEILDQPMLMGDSFPTSESMDRIRLEQEHAALISIDRSSADDDERSRGSSGDHRYEKNNNAHNNHHVHAQQPSTSQPVSAFVYHDGTAVMMQDKETAMIHAGLSEVDDMRTQLRALQNLIHDSGYGGDFDVNAVNDGETSPTKLRQLIRENDALRRQLLERDSVIKALRNQLDSVHIAASTTS